MAEPEDRKKKSKQWSEEETLVLIRSVQEREGVLFSSHSGIGGCNARKKKQWEEVSQTVSRLVLIYCSSTECEI